MSASSHVIRLQGPWRFAPEGDVGGTLVLRVPFATPLAGGRLRRTFHWTALADLRKTIRLVIRETGRPARVFLNGDVIGGFDGLRGFEADVSRLLALTNHLELELDEGAQVESVFHGAALLIQDRSK